MRWPNGDHLNFDQLQDWRAEAMCGTGELISLGTAVRLYVSSSPSPGLPAEPGLAWHWAPATARTPNTGVSSCADRSPAPHSAPTTDPH